MSITYPISLPLTPAPKTSKISMFAAASVSRSPFSLVQQAYLHPGDAWMLQLEWPVMKRAQAEPFIAALAKLKARYGTFLFGDYDGRTPRGVATGSPNVSGAGQTGETLVTQGWTHGVTGILLAGDYIQIGTGNTARMHKVLDDANSDSSGIATLNIWPRLRYSPADTQQIFVNGCVTQFRLDTFPDWDANEASAYSLSISASEAL